MVIMKRKEQVVFSVKHVHDKQWNEVTKFTGLTGTALPFKSNIKMGTIQMSVDTVDIHFLPIKELTKFHVYQ